VSSSDSTSEPLKSPSLLDMLRFLSVLYLRGVELKPLEAEAGDVGITLADIAAGVQADLSCEPSGKNNMDETHENCYT